MVHELGGVNKDSAMYNKLLKLFSIAAEKSWRAISKFPGLRRLRMQVPLAVSFTSANCAYYFNRRAT